MKKFKLREQALIQSFSAFVYIIIISLFMSNGEKIFGGGDDNILIPIAILLLLVLSVSVMGLLIFGKSILMYLEGEKKDAIKLTIYTITSLFVITAVYLGILIIIR